jgi:PPM family protein phosphatase
VSVVLNAGAATDVGLVRKVNEDSLLVGHPVYVVADGMGGHEAGDAASQAVIAALTDLVGRTALTPTDVDAAVTVAHDAVVRLAATTERGAGSTLTGVVLLDVDGKPHWLVLNIGDSRVYRARGGEFEQLTIDHSYAQQLIDSGQLDPADLATFRQRNIITRAVGSDERPADTQLVPVVAGDTLVLCSDGLTNEVTDAAIATILATVPDSQHAANRLVAAALESGGHDNVTAVVVRVVSGGADTGSTPAVTPELDNEDTIEVVRG